jgi:hypothetical protein
MKGQWREVKIRRGAGVAKCTSCITGEYKGGGRGDVGSRPVGSSAEFMKVAGPTRGCRQQECCVLMHCCYHHPNLLSKCIETTWHTHTTIALLRSLVPPPIQVYAGSWPHQCTGSAGSRSAVC